MKKSKIIVMTTGGTIEKMYDERHGRFENLENRGHLIKDKILDKLRLPHTELEIRPLMSKDSLVLTDQDRELIAAAIQKAVDEGHPVLILHGTDTMEVTAAFCATTLSPKKAVVFTGAMSPLGYDNSDAAQNVTEALLACKIMPAGVYLSFHNHIFSAPNVTKNRDKGTFEERSS